MHEHHRDIIRILSKGDTSLVACFFKKKGGRRYLENLTLILINTFPVPIDEKEVMFEGFMEVLDGMEKRLQRQQEGDEILSEVLHNY